MKVLSRQVYKESVRIRLPEISRAVYKAQQPFIPSEIACNRFFNFDIASEPVSFDTKAPNDGVHYSSKPARILEILEILDLPQDRVFADLGSGLGAVYFAAAAYFDRVFGVEYDESVLKAAEGIRSRFNITNLEFICQDILATDLTEFGVIYFYRPFLTDYIDLMTSKLQETLPGTIIISRAFGWMTKEICSPPEFRRYSGFKFDIGEYDVFQRLAS